jgi:hypothetical protein
MASEFDASAGYFVGGCQVEASPTSNHKNEPADQIVYTFFIST